MNRDIKKLEFHEMASGTATSLRDASNTAGPSRPWKHPPTPISIPTNGNAVTKNSAPAKVIRGHNPYSGRMKTTMEKKQSRADDGAGNQTASRLPLSKRPKVDGLGLASKHFTNTRPWRTSEVISGHEPISVEDTMDTDSIRHSSPDELLITTKSTAPTRMPMTFTPLEHSRHKIAQDGPSTRNLGKKLADTGPIVIQDDDNDEPSYSGDPPYIPEAGPSKPTSPRPSSAAKRRTSPTLNKLAHSGKVGAARQQYENNTASVPQIDLLRRSGNGVKKNMKGKSAGQPAAHSVLRIDRCVKDESTAPSGFINGNSPDRPPRKPRQSATIVLPLDEWARGCETFRCEYRSPPYYLVSDGQTLLVKEELDADDPIFTFKLAWANSIQCTLELLYSSNAPVIVTLKTKKALNQPQLDTERFRFGSMGHDGTIAFRIANQHDASRFRADYARLLQALPAPTYLDEHGSKVVWGGIVNAAEFPPIRTAGEHVDTPDDALKVETSGFPHALSEPGSETEESFLQVPRRTKVRKSSAQEDPIRATRVSQRLVASRRSSPALDPDEIVLIYPPSGTGAVNLTRCDLKRLEPGQYLNDTLIEFGLKLVLNDIKEQRPEFADQVHVFSSFFYKKFNVKDKEEGYRSVRKWTSKIDLFKKKYIVIPINENVHWYLAIICNPEYVLLPPPPPPPKAPAVQTRKRKRDSDVPDLGVDEPGDLGQLPTSDIRSGSPVQCRSASVSADESRVESMLDAHVVSPTLEENPSTMLPGGELNELTYPLSEDEATMEVDVMSNPAMTDDVSMGTYTRDASLEIMEAENSSASDAPRPLSPEIPMLVDEPVVIETTPSSAIPSTRFYKSSMRRRLLSVPPSEVIESAEDHIALSKQVEATYAAEAAEATELPLNTSYIFTFDSLGSKHPAAVRNLQTYLQMEARDKKKLDFASTTPPLGKNAIVPAQPNFCDCGVYLLHFVKIFLQNPTLATERILTKTRLKDYTSKERDVDWDNENVGKLREELLTSAEALSEEWKKDRAAKEEQKKKETTEVAGNSDIIEDSDDDIVVSEVVVKAKPVKGKGKGKMKLPVGETKADRLR